MAPPSTQDRLLEAAEELFAERGYDGTSLRALTSRAGANLAAVNYHFGSKEGLYRALFERRIAPIHQERLALLDILETRQPEPPTVEQLLEAFVGPTLGPRERGESGRPGSRRLLVRIAWEPRAVLSALGEPFREVRERFLRAFGRALPELDPGTLRGRLDLVVGLLHAALADPEHLGHPSEDWVAFAAAGLRA